MNLALEKQQIIEDIKNCEEEWILKAVKKLLESESKFNALHYSIVQERLEEYNKNIDEGTDLDAFKDELKKELNPKKKGKYEQIQGTCPK